MTNAALTFDAQAATYDAPRRRLIPPFDAFYGTAVEAVSYATDTPKAILELGAGTGLMSAMLHAAYPTAQLTLTDGAPAMLDQARHRLGENAATYVVADLNDDLPPGPYCAITSALAIHHLDDDGKQALFAKIFDALKPGGIFVNAEQVAGPTPEASRRYAEWQEREARKAGSDDAEWAGAEERMLHDRCASVEDQLAWLRQAGFTDVDAPLHVQRFAVFIARR